MEDTIVAISTPVGEGGIGIVRMSGQRALSVADKIFRPKSGRKPSESKTYTTHYGHIICFAAPRAPKYRPGPGRIFRDDKNAEVIDEVILTVMRSPKSYTKEDIVEINCHGGIVPLRKVLELILSLGARLAQPGEFTRRAFMNGRIDLAQAEAVLDIIRSKTEDSMKAALCQLEGELSGKINRLKKEVLNVLSEIEARIDFSEDDIEFTPKKSLSRGLTRISGEMGKLIDGANKGIILREGIMCVICGRPNAGKSSLMNAFLRRNRVIVTPVPGTTRDAIEEEISLDGIPIRIVDTAGISAGGNIVQRRGMQKSRSYIKAADLILFMLDSSKPWSKADSDIFSKIKGGKFMVIANKSDLPKRLDLKKVKRVTRKDDIMEISVLKKKNLNMIEKSILGEIWRGRLRHPEAAFITNLRHKKDLERARKRVKMAVNTLRPGSLFKPEITALALRDAVFFLGSILGEATGPDMLDRIFSKFCIGK